MTLKKINLFKLLEAILVMKVSKTRVNLSKIVNCCIVQGHFSLDKQTERE